LQQDKRENISNERGGFFLFQEEINEREFKAKQKV